MQQCLEMHQQWHKKATKYKKWKLKKLGNHCKKIIETKNYPKQGENLKKRKTKCYCRNKGGKKMKG